MIKHLFAVLVLACSFGSVTTLMAQEKEENASINWLTWEEAVEKSKEEPRKIFMEVYTDWCIWCKKMEEETYTSEAIVNYINENYYAVKFDAERRDEIRYEDKVYRFVKSGRNGYHELAAELLKGRLTFPTAIFMDEELEVIQSIAGYKTSMQFMQIVTYFGENRHRTTPWMTYKKSFNPNSMMLMKKAADH